ncbi:MAG: transcription elongation factor GreA [Candidatus Vogelbacteria bacterium]|nr:transcription elongation factor GreA [Candidatus Vogelbacteria bacterium]
MNTKNVEYLTKEKLKQLEEELRQGKTVRRKEIAEALEFAKSLGDLSENAEYQQAREAQAELEDRITVIEDILKRAVVVAEGTAKNDGSMITMGSTAIIKKDGESETRKCKIVGSEEADILSCKISNESPLGMTMLGKRVGEKFVVVTPKGKVNYIVVSVE